MGCLGADLPPATLAAMAMVAGREMLHAIMGAGCSLEEYLG